MAEVMVDGERVDETPACVLPVPIMVSDDSESSSEDEAVLQPSGGDDGSPYNSREVFCDTKRRYRFSELSSPQQDALYFADMQSRAEAELAIGIMVGTVTREECFAHYLAQAKAAWERYSGAAIRPEQQHVVDDAPERKPKRRRVKVDATKYLICDKPDTN